VTTVLLDSHVVHWWSAQPEKISRSASTAMGRADELAVAAITWFELAWLAQHGRIELSIPLRTWIDHLAARVRTVPLTPPVAATAVTLPESFLGDPADRLIYATAIEYGWKLITKDRRLLEARVPGGVALW
jgi:PIN domain nuclease of toxin-antitoxin system